MTAALAVVVGSLCGLIVWGGCLFFLDWLDGNEWVRWL